MPLILSTRRVVPVVVCAAASRCLRVAKQRLHAAAASAGDACAGRAGHAFAGSQLRHLRRHDQGSPLGYHAAAGRRQPFKILVKSGDLVKAGQVLMVIDPLKQVATVQSQEGTQAQKKALYDYTKIEVERQRKLFEAGVVSRDAYDQATQAYRERQGGLRGQRSPYRYPEAAAGLLRDSRAFCRRCRRHPSSHRRLCFSHHGADHGG